MQSAHRRRPLIIESPRLSINANQYTSTLARCIDPRDAWVGNQSSSVPKQVALVSGNYSVETYELFAISYLDPREARRQEESWMIDATESAET